MLKATNDSKKALKDLTAELQIGPIPGFLFCNKAMCLAADRLIKEKKATWVRRYVSGAKSLVRLP